MKQNMIIWVFAALMALLPSSTMMAAAQQHRHTPRTTIVDDKAKQQAANDSAAAAQAAQPDAAVAYSDTTSIDEEEDYQPSAYRVQYQSQWEDEDKEFAEHIFDKLAESGHYIVAIVFIIFIGAPISILIMILYFINRNRRDRIRLAEKAIEHGQPIPGTERIVYREAKPKAERRYTSAPRTAAEHKEYIYDEDLRTRGIKHLAIGLGLMVCCLTFWQNDFFGGIGFLIACFGAGQMYMARTTKKVVEQKPIAETADEPEADETEADEAEEPKAEEAKDFTNPKD